jgi:hypothetical protein
MIDSARDKADARILEQHGAVLNLKRDCHEHSLRLKSKRDIDLPSHQKRGLKFVVLLKFEWVRSCHIDQLLSVN